MLKSDRNLRKELVPINLWLGKYRVLSLLSSSSTSVFLAENVRLQENCIIKKIPKTHPFYSTICQEAYFLRTLKSDFIPLLYDMEEDEENLYIIEEYIEGFSPTSENLKKEGYSEKEVLHLVDSLARFLKGLHNSSEPILYLDWKPENIIVSGKRIKVIDFGSAIQKKDSPACYLTTEGYSAPELLQKGEVDTYTDVYGFGCLIEEMARAVQRERGFFFKKSIVERLLFLSFRCKDKNPERRCSVEEILKETDKMKRCSKGFKVREEWFPVSKEDYVIGISGGFRGVGVTHIAALFAKKLSLKGKKVAFLDFHPTSNHREVLQKISKISKKIDVFQCVDSYKFVSILNQKYDHILIDFGLLRESILVEFLRCDKKYVVVQKTFTKAEYLKDTLMKYSSYFRSGNIEILANLSMEKEGTKIRKMLQKYGVNQTIRIQKMESIE